MLPFLDLRRVNAPYETAIADAMRRVATSGRYLHGDATSRFEREWATYVGTRHCVAVSNGLDALRLVLRGWMALGRLRAGDEVIVPANTYIASILAISDCGLVPVPVEPDASTMLLTAEGVQRGLTERTRAVMPVHLYGQTCLMDAIMTVADARGLLVVEDCAQSHGSTLTSQGRTRRSGSLGHAAAFSFYPTKNLGALGDAGAVTTDDDDLAVVVQQIANYGASAQYVHRYKGLNCRMDEVQAAVLSVKLPHLEAANARRRAIAACYASRLHNPHVALPVVATDSVWHLYVVRCSERDALRRHLEERGVGTMIHYPIPPHREQAYAEWAALQLPLTERLAGEVLSLPCNASLTDDEVTLVVDAVNDFSIR